MRRTLMIVVSAVLVSSGAAQANGLVAAYAFSGTTTSGKYGNGLLLAGDAAGERVPSAEIGDVDVGLTVEAWIMPATVSGYPKLVWRDGSNGSPYNLGLAFGNGTVVFSVSTTAGRFTAFAYTSIVPNVWTHVAGTYDGTALRIYVNGVSTASATASGAIVASTQDLWLGRAPWGEALIGSLDEVRIYGRPLSAAEIAIDRDTQVNGLDPPEVGAGNPVPDQMGVSPATTVRATFSKLLDAATVTESTFFLTGPSGTVAATVTYDETAHAATLTPAAPLALLTTYTAHVTTDISGLDEGALRAPVDWTFTTSPDPALAHAAYAFDEGAGVISVDSSGNGNTAALTRSGLWTSAGRYRNGLALVGATDGVRVPAAPSLEMTTALTVESWVYPTSIAGYPKLIWRDGENNAPYTLAMAWGNGSVGLTVVTTTGTYSVFAYAALAVDVWAHVAGTYDGSALRIYINGQLMNSVPASGAVVPSTRDLWLGRAPWGEGFNGTIDDVRLYGRALAADEIAVDMATPAADATPPAVLSVAPGAGMRNVALNTALRVVFSEALDPATITSSTLLVRDTRNVAVNGIVSYDPELKTATFVPASPLLPTRTFSAVVVGGANGIADVAGNRLVSDYTWTFVTTVESVRIAAGQNHSVAVDDAGQVWTWGGGAQQLGTMLDGRVPGRVTAATGVVSVGAGASHTLALKSDGTLLVWGANGSGQLGINSLMGQAAPVAVPGLTGVVAVAAGSISSMALKSDGTVWTWGYSHLLGTGQGTDSKVPVQVPGLVDVIAVASGDFAALALKADGTVWAWGDNVSGQVGDGTSGAGALRLTPVQVTSLAGIVGIAGGASHSLAIVGSDLSVRAWGLNTSGQLGNAATTSSSLPVTVTGLTDVRHIDGGGARSVAALLDGTVKAWGADVTAAGGNSSVAITVPGNPIGAQAAAGAFHAASISSAGTVWTWGTNTQGQLGDGSTVSRQMAAPISADAFSWNVAPPQFSRATGTYAQPFTVTITSLTSNATMHYTTTGADPTESDPLIATGGTVTVNRSLTLKARAWKAGSPTSGITSAVYTLQVVQPSFSPVAGTYAAPQMVAISTTTPGATIRVTSDGTTPTAASTVYTAPVTVATTTTLKAAASLAGWSDSTVRTGTYTMNFGTLAAPTISPAAGSYEREVVVTLSAEPHSTIRYTTDGTVVSSSSPVYTNPLTLSETRTVRAKSFRVDYTTSSELVATYTIMAKAPSISLASGTYPRGTFVTITDADPAVTIRVTFNGADPTTADASVPSGTALLVGGYVLKARGFKTGTGSSVVVSAIYALTERFSGGAVAAGLSHTVLTTPQGLTYAWGDNDYGQLGNGTTTQKRLLIAVPLTGVVAIAAGSTHTLAATWDGRLFGWGANGSFQVGDGSTLHRSSPVALTGVPPVVAVAAGTSHSLALAADGHVYAWGTGPQLGLGSTNTATTPTLIGGLADVVGIAAGASHSLAVTRDGRLYAWGSNGSSQLGDGTVTTRTTPQPISSIADVIAVKAGQTHSLARVGSGAVYAWGGNASGQLGLGNQTLRSTPTLVAGVVAADIAAGGSESMALRGEGVLAAWGANNAGQLGDGTTGGVRTSPVAVSNLSQVALMAAGSTHSIAVTLNGHVLTWGLNSSGQLGDGLTTNRATPFEVFVDEGEWGTTPVPTLSVAPGTFNTPQVVIVSNALGTSANMHYTTSGADPTEDDPAVADGASLLVDQTTTFKFRTWVAGRSPSAVLTAAYVLQPDMPDVTPGSGIYASAQTVAISSGTSDTQVRYTLDGTDPTSLSPLYFGPIAVHTFTVLKARAFRPGWTPSATATATFTFNYGTLATPAAMPPGDSYPSGQIVTLAGPPAAQIRYTLDGMDPDVASTAYTTPFALPDGFITLKARAFAVDWTPSATLVESYIITDDTAPPTISASVLPDANAAGWHRTDVTVTFTCEDASAVKVCTAPLHVGGEGAGIPVTGSGTDIWGNHAIGGWTVNIDKTPPAVHVYAPRDGATLPPTTTSVTVRGGAAELSGLQSVLCNSVPAIVTGNLFSCAIDVVPGANIITIEATDVAGNMASSEATFAVGESTISGIEISPGTMTIGVGESREVVAQDQNGNELHGGEWAVADPTVATVAEEGGIVTVTALAEGDTTLSVAVNGFTAIASVTVLAAGATPPAGTTLWSLHDALSFGAPKRGEVLRATSASEDDPGKTPALFFVDEGAEWSGPSRARINDRPTRIRTTTADGRQLSDVRFTGRIPQQIAADNNGGFIVVLPARDGLPSTIQRFDSRSGLVAWEYITTTGFLSDVAIHPNGRIYSTEQRLYGTSALIEITPDGRAGEWPLPRGHYKETDSGVCALDEDVSTPAAASGPIVREDGAVVLITREMFSFRPVESYRDYDGTCKTRGGVPLSTGASAHVIELTETGMSVRDLDIRQFDIPTQGYDTFQLMPDGHGGLLLAARDYPSVFRISTDYRVVAWNHQFLPDDDARHYEVEYVLGEDGGYAIVNSMRAYADRLAYESKVFSFDPETLAKTSETDLGIPMPEAQHLRLKFALAGGGVYAVGPTAAYVVNPTIDTAGFAAGGNASHIAAGMWGGWSGAAAVAYGSEAVIAQSWWAFPSGAEFGNVSGPVPLTTTRLRELAEQRGIGVGLAGIQKNRAIGLAFQGLAIWSLYQREDSNTFFLESPERSNFTGAQVNNVVPDFLGSYIRGTHPGSVVFPNSVLSEVKAVSGILNLSYSRHQIRGLVDAATRSPLGETHTNWPMLEFVTTADTLVGLDVVANATAVHVEVRQRVVTELPGGFLRVGPGRSLNGSVWTMFVTGQTALPALLPGRAAERLGTHLGESPIGDPDPPTVEP